MVSNHSALKKEKYSSQMLFHFVHLAKLLLLSVQEHHYTYTYIQGIHYNTLINDSMDHCVLVLFQILEVLLLPFFKNISISYCYPNHSLIVGMFHLIKTFTAYMYQVLHSNSFSLSYTSSIIFCLAITLSHSFQTLDKSRI